MKKEESSMTNLTKFYILILLKEGPRHGYDIIDEIGKRSGKKPSAGQVYPLLKNLQRLGHVTQETSFVGKRKKKVYKLTASGKKMSIDLLAKFSNLLDMAIQQKLTSCAHCQCEVYRGVYKKKVKGKNLSFCCQNCANSF